MMLGESAKVRCSNQSSCAQREHIRLYSIPTVSSVKSLRVIINSTLSFNNHVNKITTYATYAKPCVFTQVRRFTGCDTANTIATDRSTPRLLQRTVLRNISCKYCQAAEAPEHSCSSSSNDPETKPHFCGPLISSVWLPISENYIQVSNNNKRSPGNLSTG